jgi:hypothetical protein
MTRWYDLIKNAPNFLEYTEFLTLRSFISLVMDYISIAETVSASQDKEVWVEIQSYRDREHLDEFMANMRKIVIANPFTSSICISHHSRISYYYGRFTRLRNLPQKLDSVILIGESINVKSM